MKKVLIITESQYKRLVSKGNLLTERFKKIIYNDPKDEYDAHPDLLNVLNYLLYLVQLLYNKDLYVDKIENGVVYIDSTKYEPEEIDYLKQKLKEFIKDSKDPKDKISTSHFGFDSGLDDDYQWDDVADVEDTDDVADVEDNDDVADVEDNDDVADVEDTEDVEDNDDVADVEDNDDVADVVDISYCDYGLNSKGEKRNFVPPPNMDIKFYQDILKSIDANVTCQKMLFFYSWRTGESSKSTYNPFATTQPNEVNEGCYYNCLKSGRGYTPVGCRECPSGTLPGVRNYKTYESGLKNTVKTLTNGRYNNVVTKLKNDNITAEEIASEKSELKTWGTGGLVLDILKYNKKVKPTPISKYGDEPKYVLSDDEILDCENCIPNIYDNLSDTDYYYDDIINNNNVKDFRWWINQDSGRLKQVTDKLKECCETKSDPTITTNYNKMNNHTEIAFSVVGQEWVNSGKPKRTFEILDIDETNLIKPSSNYGNSRDYGWRDPIPSLCNEGKTRYCRKHWHGGEDYPYPNGTEIYVFQTGEVIEKGDYTLKIKHDDGSKTRYVHCDEFFVEKGDRIESGTLIGTVGNKGPSTSPHLHFEYWKPNKNKKSNPKDIEDNYIRFKL